MARPRDATTAGSTPGPWPSASPIPPGPERRTHTRCPLHHVELDATGFCAVAQAWWWPTFRCPHCAGPLWDNGFCPTCTPRRREFVGDYFEQIWTADAGPAWGHYRRISAGPTPVPGEAEVAGFLAELHARIKLGRLVADAEPLPTRD